MLVWIDGNGTVTEQAIDSDDWRGELALLDGATTFIRAEIVARASRERLIAEFTAAAMERGELPWQLQGSHLADEPIRRAISNPVYIDLD